MSRSRYRAMPVTEKGRGLIGWCVLDAGSVRMAIGYTGSFAWWRARFRAATLNRRQP